MIIWYNYPQLENTNKIKCFYNDKITDTSASLYTYLMAAVFERSIPDQIITTELREKYLEY